MRDSIQQEARGVGLAVRFVAFAFLILAAAPTQAFSVFFDGPSGFGIGESNALDAQAAGVSLFSTPSLLPIDGIVASVTKNLDVGSVVNPASPSRSLPVEGTSLWSVAFTASGADIATASDNAWLLLVRSTDFAPGNAGLDLDPSLGWAVVIAQDADTTFFYPAVRLAPTPLAGTRDVTVRYRVAQSLPNIDGVLTFPQFQGGIAVAPIPEPGTLLLLAVGLFGLMAAGHRPCR